jgi:hypothetical protein
LGDRPDALVEVQTDDAMETLRKSLGSGRNIGFGVVDEPDAERLDGLPLRS